MTKIICGLCCIDQILVVNYSKNKDLPIWLCRKCAVKAGLERG